MSKNISQWPDQFNFYLLLLLVVLSPLPLGSNREWSWLLLAVVTGILGINWLIGSFWRVAKQSSKPQTGAATQLNPIAAGVIVLFLLSLIWAYLQTVRWVPQSWYHPFWAMAEQALGHNLTASISVSAADTSTAIIRLISYAVIFFLALQYGRNRKNAYVAIRVLALSGMAYAIFGLISFWGGSDKLFWLQDSAFKAAVHSSFINRNSYATFAGLGLLCAIAWLNQAISRKRSNQVYSMPVGRELRVEQFFLKAWLPLIAILLISTALILTSSRGGFISSFIAVLALLLALNSRQKTGGLRARLIIVTVVIVAVLAFWMSSEVLLSRMEKIDVENNQRLIVYQLISQSIEQGNIKGNGYGSFADSFRMYRSNTVYAHYDKAHNTYLENIFELGWPAALCLFASIGWLGLICFQGVKKRHRDWVYPATGLAATILVATHASVDFSLQIPAVAVTYACIMGIATQQSYSTPKLNRQPDL